MSTADLGTVLNKHAAPCGFRSARTVRTRPARQHFGGSGHQLAGFTEGTEHAG